MVGEKKLKDNIYCLTTGNFSQLGKFSLNPHSCFALYFSLSYLYVSIYLKNDVSNKQEKEKRKKYG